MKFLNDESKQDVDLRTYRAAEIKKIMTMPGFKMLEDEYNSVKELAFSDLINEGLQDETLKERQIIYNQVCEWLEIPQNIIQQGKDAIEDEKKSKLEKPTFIKGDVPYMGKTN